MKNNSSDAPVGTIIPYSGDAKTQRDTLKAAGWLICDGAELSQTEYKELFDTIGQAFGSPADGRFNIPDFRGLFLRGVSEDSGNDPDAASRTALHDNGNAGNAVGSFQPWATGKPRKDFTATIPKNKIGNSKLDKGACVDDAGKYRDEDGYGDTDGTGGDKETRPINVYVYYLIKWKTTTNSGGLATPPVGTVMAYAGHAITALASNWASCEGAERQRVGKFESLFAAIGTAFGSTGDNKFNLPDLRGYFLRGVNMDAENRDPEAEGREALQPGGNTGNAVGSKQADATGYPVSKPFRTAIPHLPNQSGAPAMSGFAKDVYKWNNNSSGPIALTTGGGDEETRPINTAVAWHVLYQQLLSDDWPVGTIIAYGGSTLPENDYWLPCKGQIYPQHTYSALYAVVKNLYNNPDQSIPADAFQLPDLRGKFLRGAQGDTQDDDPVIGQTQPYATKRPGTPFSASFDHLPTSSKGTHGVTNSNNTADNGQYEQSTCTDGGDSESRPINVAVHFYIKANK